MHIFFYLLKIFFFHTFKFDPIYGIVGMNASMIFIDASFALFFEDTSQSTARIKKKASMTFIE